MEIEDLARSGTGMAGRRFGVAAARPLAERPRLKVNPNLAIRVSTDMARTGTEVGWSLE
jgi:hypothetical protein